ncbi:MAG TPA: hypothetical protein VGL47_14995 [Amycolatopsis sp.]|uniref:Uncharacterized protein n=1 Tax=Amycolatopsis nalaikhensis TaxID=715472 RepID=A0ABY8XEQ5_9PSEU|nr:hypothetical protein [Amycolatopsis sp. 2-2]WIV54094.1 hypothetical protein QP939_35235 [Amycolatopsis sp. 2-2]
MNPAAGRIAQLRAHGFVIRPLPNPFGVVDGLHATRTGLGWVDSVVIRGPEYAVAVRVVDTFTLADPFAESAVAWSESGDVVEVVDKLLALCLSGTAYEDIRTLPATPDEAALDPIR